MATVTIEVAGREFSPKEFDDEEFGPKEAREIKVDFSCPYCGYKNESCFHHYVPSDYKHICDSCGGPIPLTEDVFPSDTGFVSPSGTDYLQDHLTALEGFTDIPEKKLLQLYVRYQNYLTIGVLASMLSIIVASLFGFPEVIGGGLLIGLLLGSVVVSYIAEKQFENSWDTPPVTFRMLAKEPYRSLYIYQSSRKEDGEGETQDISPSQL